MAIKDKGKNNSVDQSLSWLNKKAQSPSFLSLEGSPKKMKPRKTDEPLTERKSNYLIINIAEDRESAFP